MAQPTSDEKNKSWHDLTPERKKQLEMGGGLAAGAALLGGGYMAFRHHQKSEEDKKAEAWALSNWHEDAQQRTQQFNQQGPQAPFTWILAEGTNIPQGALEGGRDGDGSPLYIARAYYEGGLHLGKAGRHLGKGASIPYGGKEVEVEKYEILLADPNRVKWVDGNELQGSNPVEGGKEQDGTPLYIGQAFYENGTHPGKFSQRLGGTHIAWGGKEVACDRYRILVLN
ncbi:hypothetical protein BOTBODRAFT_540120 [Botryobasidium botryosum FD-172 SS1]|uniref:DUF3421 domain-containing protein n=1 Tax=Botryobasidium botryosum (strain FD-172 SS1) TaxID=930990 RepID=A0A067LZR2_BOTB1|nr:hypothetical protein BOTBODRAFT_540120 [Botryobasidium botryosum FD-172 SS1]